MKQLKILNYNLINENKDLFSKIGLQAVVSDFSCVQGAYIGDYFGGLFSSTYKNNVCNPSKKTSSYYILKNKNGISSIDEFGVITNCNLDDSTISNRFVLDIDSDIKKVIDETNYYDRYGIKVIKYLNYPQNAVNHDLNNKLENLYNSNNLCKNKNTYLYKCSKDKDNFIYDELEVYNYKKNKYVRTKLSISNTLEFSNGEKYSNGEYVWIKVLPINWYVDEINNIIISEKALCSGYKYSYDNKCINYEVSDLNKILNNKILFDLYQNDSNKLTVSNTSLVNNNVFFFDSAFKLMELLDLKKSAYYLNMLEKKKNIINNNSSNSLLNIGILSKKDVNGNKMIEILKRYGTFAYYTDFSRYFSGQKDYNQGNYWLSNLSFNGEALYYDTASVYNTFKFDNVDSRKIGVRPIISGYYLRNHNINIEDRIYIQSGYEYILFGKYPNKQTFAFGDALEKKYSDNNLEITNNYFTFDKNQNLSEPFSEIKYPVYKFFDKEYIRVIANHDNLSSTSFGYKKGDAIWFEVCPIEWLYDKNSDLLISKDTLLCGIQFNYNRKYNGKFETTDLKKYLDNYFEKEILQYEKDFYIKEEPKQLVLKK